MPIFERWTVHSGPRIRYLDNAPSDAAGAPILFSPGLSDVADEYVEMLRYFAPRRVLVVEVRGRGHSEAPPSGYALADHVADLEAVLEQEAIDRFHLMTFSRGTSWGLQLAIDHPDRVLSIAIGDYRAAEVALPDGFSGPYGRTSFRGRAMAERIPRRVLERVAADSRARDLWDGLAHLQCPLLVARAGSGRGILDSDFIERYRSARPDVEVVVVPDAPHDLFRPDRLFYPRAVARFLQRACPGA